MPLILYADFITNGGGVIKADSNRYMHNDLLEMCAKTNISQSNATKTRKERRKKRYLII